MYLQIQIKKELHKKVIYVKFMGKIWKSGNAHVITVPSAFIKYGQLEEGEEYQIHFRKKIEIDIDKSIIDKIKSLGLTTEQLETAFDLMMKKEVEKHDTNSND